MCFWIGLLHSHWTCHPYCSLSQYWNSTDFLHFRLPEFFSADHEDDRIEKREEQKTVRVEPWEPFWSYYCHFILLIFWRFFFSHSSSCDDWVSASRISNQILPGRVARDCTTNAGTMPGTTQKKSGLEVWINAFKSSQTIFGKKTWRTSNLSAFRCNFFARSLNLFDAIMCWMRQPHQRIVPEHSFLSCPGRTSNRWFGIVIPDHLYEKNIKNFKRKWRRWWQF